jgi:hypothetical protein
VALPTIECHPRLALQPSSDSLREPVGSLISAIRSDDHRTLASLLQPLTSSSAVRTNPPPFLVNYPDVSGWSAIHYCVAAENPSSAILDILYAAGADVSLPTRSGQGSPLHCLARHATATTPSAVQDFIRHLVFDLCAPLCAVDPHEETCLHVAAEHGESMDVLIALLACDSTGTVREMRNSRGYVRRFLLEVNDSCPHC